MSTVRPVDADELRARVRRGGHDVRRPEGVENVDVASLERRLQEKVRGDVHFEAGWRAAFAHDSSNYRQPPLGVVLPRDGADVEAAVAASREHGAPVLPRGCGTSLSGETCNVAVVIDMSKYMREIVEVDPDRRLARVQPGVIRDQLSNQTEARFNLTFAPDTSTHEYATFGGMLGNNSCGIHSVMAGRTSDNVHELDILLYDGTRMRVGETSEEELARIIAAGGRRGEIYARLRDLRDRYAALVRDRYPEIPRRVSGYNLDDLLPEKGFNVARALVGTEGTCATVLEATVRLVHSPPARSLLVLGYPDVFSAADHVPEVMQHGPVGLEGMDRRLIEDMQVRHEHLRDLTMLPEGGGWLLVEFGGETKEESDERARECMTALAKDSNPPDMSLFDDDEQEARLWEVREAGLGATAYVPMERDHWPGWEDAAVPPERMGAYLREFRSLLERHDYRAALYGHFGQGCIHCRISFDLRSPGGVREWRSFLDEAADLVVAHGGSLSGEHGDGQQRAELLPKMYGPEIVQAFREFKAIWDPDNRMNPHKVVDPYPIVSNLKLGAGYRPPEPKTHFAYPQDGGSFAHAALRCVGAGKCRSTDTGTMCPSYMVTLDEEHTTRGRARILYEMLEGDVITDGFRSKEVNDALDLCLSCKGCKGDCPVNVDMATYKAEFLSHHYRRRLRPAAAYSMGLIMLHARLARLAPGLANAVAGTAPAKLLAGISPRREMPPFAGQTFRDWHRERTPPASHGEPVVLFADTFNDNLHPEVLKATLEVLEAAGRQVIVPDEWMCCGRPLYDYGMLDTAKRFWKRTLAVLAPHIQAGTPVVAAEPSCVAAFRDELPNLLPHDEDAKRLSLQTLTLSEYPDRALRGMGDAADASPGGRPRPLPSRGRHGHGRRSGGARSARPGLRGAGLRLLRDGRVVRLRARAPRHLGQDRRAPSAARRARGLARLADRRGRLLVQDAGHPGDGPPAAAHRTGDPHGHGARSRRPAGQPSGVGVPGRREARVTLADEVGGPRPGGGRRGRGRGPFARDAPVSPVVVVTGASAGVGRAAVREFARHGYDVALLARGEAGLDGARREVEGEGRRALPVPVDVVDAAAVDEAAGRVEAELGPIDVWVNDAMATVFAYFDDVEPEEFVRATEVTYLGTVWGTRAALKRMLPRDRGTIVQVGSAMAYRGIPLQSPYCGSKQAIKGFQESLRTELRHRGSSVHLTMVQLPGLNTPQFEHGRNKMPHPPQPVPPVYSAELAARAIRWAASQRRREIYVGAPTVYTILGNKLAPWVADRYLARTAVSGQQIEDSPNGHRPDNLFGPMPRDEGADGPFEEMAHPRSLWFWGSRHRRALTALGAAGAAAGAAAVVRRHS